MHFLCYDTALNEEFTLIKLLQRYPQNLSLFHGTDDEKIWDAAPYLFNVKSNYYLLKQESSLIRLDYSVLFETNEKLIDIVQFLQSFIYKKIHRDSVYFRVWDARVLINSFKSWTAKEQLKFFEFFNCFYTENVETDFFDKWTFGQNDLIATKILKAALLPDKEPLPKEMEEEELDQSSQKKAEVKPEEEKPLVEEVKIEAPKRRRFFIE